jgi:hypothetical protein
VTGRTVVLAATVALFGIGCSDDGGGAESATTTATSIVPGQALDELVPGDCLVEVPDAPLGRVETVDCEHSHRAEVYAVHDVDDGSFPEVDRLSAEAALRCVALYEAYAGEPVDPTTDQALAEIVPSEASWAEGDRYVVCLALPPAGASVEGSIAATAGPGSP